MVLPGPISLFSRNAVADAGWFDESTMVEDWDITMKMHKKGYKIVSDKKAVSNTIAPSRLKEWWRQRTRWSRGGIQIAVNHSDVWSKSDNRALKGLVFPLHVLWLMVPFVVVPTMIYILIPSQIVITNIMADLSMLFSTIGSWLFSGAQASIVKLYTILDRILIDFIDPMSMDWVRAFGYLTIVAFISFTYVSIKAFKKDFRPRDFITIILMPIYWLMMNAVYLYSFFLEAVKRKLIW